MRRLLILLCVALAACARVTSPMGPPRVAPHLTDQAMIAADGARLPLKIWRPKDSPRAVLLALHGFDDYSAFFDLAGPVLADAGILVYAYDQRGFGAAPDIGLWPGVATLQADFYTALRLLAERHPGLPLYALGHSMGGAVLLTALAHPAIDHADIPPLAGAVLVAPAVWSRDEMPWAQSLILWLGSHTVPWMTLTGRGLHIQASDNIAMLRKMSADPLVIKETRIDAMAGLCDLMDQASLAAAGFAEPALVQIADQDQVVPPLASDQFLKRLPPGLTIAHYPQGYHMLMLDLHRDVPVGDIIRFIRGPA